MGEYDVKYQVEVFSMFSHNSEAEYNQSVIGELFYTTTAFNPEKEGYEEFINVLRSISTPREYMIINTMNLSVSAIKIQFIIRYTSRIQKIRVEELKEAILKWRNVTAESKNKKLPRRINNVSLTSEKIEDLIGKMCCNYLANPPIMVGNMTMEKIINYVHIYMPKHTGKIKPFKAYE